MTNAGELMLSRDRKVSPRGTMRSNPRPAWVPAVRNSFGLPSGTSCPGRTPFCESCYAGNSEQSSGVLPALQRNHRMLLDAAASSGVAGMHELLSTMLDTYWRQGRKLEAKHRVFRIHWDGDFFSLDYARAWALAMAEHPGVTFWAYTRSFVEPVNVVPVLAAVPNLSLYLSVDRHNAEAAHVVAAEHPSVLLALCDEDYRSARQLAPADRPSSIVCPENIGRMRLMEDGVGACVTCGVCVTGRRDVLFSTSHREDVNVVVRISRPKGSRRACDRVGCDQTFEVSLGPGRPRRFCSTECRTLNRRSA